jgi:serine/threonine protein kinase
MSIICQGCAAELATWTGHCPHCGWTTRVEVKQRQDALIGRVIGGRYKIVEKLGQGGMGAVYLAEHTGVGQRVAVKFLNPSFSGDPDVVRRFLNEAKSYGQIAHPHAVQLHDFGQDEDGNLYISMEYVEGQDLKRVLEKEKRFSLKDALDIVLQVCDVLGYAHSKGIVHRDLKPENIMLVKGLRGYHAKVLDFGVARLMGEQSTRVTATGSITGTPRYMSPEQAEGKEVDHRTDVYALGLVLYECVVGAHPFGSATIAETLRRQVVEPVPRLSEARPDLRLPDALDAAIQRAVEKSRERRFQSMKDFAEALVRLVPTASLDAPSPDGGSELTAISQKREKTAHQRSPFDRDEKSRGGLIAGVSAAAVVVLGIGGYLVLKPTGERPPLDLVPTPIPSVPAATATPRPEVKDPPAAEGSGGTPSAGAEKVPDSGERPAERGALVARVETPRPTAKPGGSPGRRVEPGGAVGQVGGTIAVEAVANTGVEKINESTYLQAFAKYEAGELEVASRQLKTLAASSLVGGELREKITGLQERIRSLQSKLREANEAMEKGRVDDAARLFKQVKDINPHVKDAIDGLKRCDTEKRPQIIF